MTRVMRHITGDMRYPHYKHVWIGYDMKNLFIVSNKIQGLANFLFRAIRCIIDSVGIDCIH
jgi:hypothetical protein